MEPRQQMITSAPRFAAHLATLPRLQTASNKGKPLGWTADADWQNCVDLLVKTEQMEKPVAVSTLYTNAFIPT